MDRDSLLRDRTVCGPPSPGGEAGADDQAGQRRALGDRGEEGRRAAARQVSHQV